MKVILCELVWGALFCLFVSEYRLLNHIFFKRIIYFLKVKVTERDGETEKNRDTENFCWLILSARSCSIQSCARQRQQSSVLLCLRGGRPGCASHLLLLFPGITAGSWIRREQRAVQLALA